MYVRTKTVLVGQVDRVCCLVSLPNLGQGCGYAKLVRLISISGTSFTRALCGITQQSDFCLKCPSKPR
jgi:hypothetical protein